MLDTQSKIERCQIYTIKRRQINKYIARHKIENRKVPCDTSKDTLGFDIIEHYWIKDCLSQKWEPHSKVVTLPITPPQLFTGHQRFHPDKILFMTKTLHYPARKKKLPYLNSLSYLQYSGNLALFYHMSMWQTFCSPSLLTLIVAVLCSKFLIV